MQEILQLRSYVTVQYSPTKLNLHPALQQEEQALRYLESEKADAPGEFVEKSITAS